MQILCQWPSKISGFSVGPVKGAERPKQGRPKTLGHSWHGPPGSERFPTSHGSDLLRVGLIPSGENVIWSPGWAHRLENRRRFTISEEAEYSWVRHTSKCQRQPNIEHFWKSQFTHLTGIPNTVSLFLLGAPDT